MNSRFSFLVVIVILFFLKSELVFAQIDPLTHWTYGDSTFYYLSGLMDLTNSSDSLTVFLTNQEISCSNIPIDPHNIGGAWIEVEFPNFTVQNYTLGEIWGTMSCWIVCPYYGYCFGYLGSAGITSIDTVDKRVLGWIDFEIDMGYTVSAYGSFNVPYCLPTIISVPENSYNNLPNSFELHQNYPNPFNPSTTIEFDLPKTSAVTLKVFNILGEEVTTLVSDRLSAGSYSYDWDASSLASGVYLYRLQAGDYVQTRKMVLMR